MSRDELINSKRLKQHLINHNAQPMFMQARHLRTTPPTHQFKKWGILKISVLIKNNFTS